MTVLSSAGTPSLWRATFARPRSCRPARSWNASAPHPRRSRRTSTTPPAITHERSSPGTSACAPGVRRLHSAAREQAARGMRMSRGLAGVRARDGCRRRSFAPRRGAQALRPQRHGSSSTRRSSRSAEHAPGWAWSRSHRHSRSSPQLPGDSARPWTDSVSASVGLGDFGKPAREPRSESVSLSLKPPIRAARGADLRVGECARGF